MLREIKEMAWSSVWLERTEMSSTCKECFETKINERGGPAQILDDSRRGV
jgi:hypothetical protein